MEGVCMLHTLRNITLALALAAGAAALAAAEDLTIDGLGTIPFGREVTVTDGGHTAINRFFIDSSHQKDYGNTANAAMWSVLTVPPGMQLYPEKPPYPYDSLHIYQLKKSKVKGLYTASLFVIRGTEEEFFHEGKKRNASFWKNAFREDAGRPTSLFGLPKIQLSEFQDLLDHVMEEKGGKGHVRIQAFEPWRAYKADDGTYHWAQEARIVMTNEKGLSFPMWIYSALFKEKDNYFLILTIGSHATAEEMEKVLLYGYYQLKRSEG